MLEVEVATECNHLFVVRIESMLATPKKGDAITCGVCKQQTTIRTVGVPGRIREDKPKSQEQKDMFNEE